MANEYLRLNDTQLNIQKAENLLAIIESKRKDAVEKKEIQSESSLFTNLFAAFKDFFSKLGKPTIKKRLLKLESPVRSKDYNDTALEIYNDLHVAYDETDSLASIVVKDFNYSEVERQMLLGQVKSLNSKSLDYSFYSSGAKTQSLFVVDDFTDNSKVDFTKISAGSTAAELVTSQGVVTLKRSGNIDRNPLVTKVTGVKDTIPPWDSGGGAGGYEGLYYGMQNEARPEGGQWHLTYSPDGTMIFENGATEEELMPRRMQMFDNNADTFWEVEFLSKPIVGYKDKYTGKQISVAEFNSLTANEVNSPSTTVTGGTVSTGETGSLIENYVPVTGTSQATYLNCSFIVHLSRTETINWISLNPYNFNTELYLDVLSVQTSPDGATFEELEGFDDHEYETTLTDKANSELNPQEVKDTLSPDQFKFAGQGVWVFAPRRANAIKFNIRQTRSYLKPYEVLVAETEYSVTTATETKQYWGLKHEETQESVIHKNQTEIPYLIGLIMGFDVMSLEPSDENITSVDSGPLADLINMATNSGPGGLVAGVLAAPFILPILPILSFFGKSTTTNVAVSEQRITRQWKKTKNDISRFAIGVRDINLYSYTFAETSEIVSKPFISPKPISKLALTVDETIPKNFYSSNPGTENDWIKYYLSIDNGTSWYRISPTNHRTTTNESGGIIPEILNINSDVPTAERKNPLAYIDVTEAVYTVRFKAVLSRPTNLGDSGSYTPVLSKYSLQIYPLGGL